MDDTDRDDYERRQAELELAGPDVDLIERYPGDRVPGTTDEFNYDDIVGRRAATLTLKFPARCAACDKPMAVVEESVGKKQGGRWLQFHPYHASQGTSTAHPVARLDPDERGFHRDIRSLAAGAIARSRRGSMSLVSNSRRDGMSGILSAPRREPHGCRLRTRRAAMCAAGSDRRT